MELTRPEPWLRFACEQCMGSHVIAYDFALHQPWTAIFGASGSGKTTLLKLIAGVLPQQHGTCAVMGSEKRHLPAHRRRLALVDQAASLFPHLSVAQNVAFGAGAQYGRSLEEELKTVLLQFSLIDLASARPARLSGGESQRVAIARAVFSQPDALLLDESFSGLDLSTRERLRELLLRVQLDRARAGRPMPILSVTHDVGEVFATASEVLRVAEGRVVTQGSPAEVLHEERQALLRRLAATA